MSQVTRAPVQLIKSRQEGQVVAKHGRLEIENANESTATELSGFYDSSTGTLLLNIPNYEPLTIAGFFTANQIPDNGGGSNDGNDGRDGIDGLIGLNGAKGDIGCRGPEGPRGKIGPVGPRGFRGNTGATGATGATGPKGEDGKILVFVQEDDPGAQANAIWVRPL